LIVDTNALSAMAEGEPAIEPLLLQAAQVSIPVIVLGEYRYGILQSRDRAKYEQWLGEYLAGFRILEIGVRTAQHYADLRVELKRAGKPIPTNDAWIAALSRQHSLPILSRDRHFDGVPGVQRLSW
jgi:predicted nucleic acid-binding protein